jgi:hypothetical protein
VLVISLVREDKIVFDVAWMSTHTKGPEYNKYNTIQHNTIQYNII